MPEGKRRARDADADEYLPHGKRQAPERKKRRRIMIVNPVADAVAHFVTERGELCPLKALILSCT